MAHQSVRAVCERFLGVYSTRYCPRHPWRWCGCSRFPQKVRRGLYPRRSSGAAGGGGCHSKRRVARTFPTPRTTCPRSRGSFPPAHGEHGWCTCGNQGDGCNVGPCHVPRTCFMAAQACFISQDTQQKCSLKDLGPGRVHTLREYFLDRGAL